MQTDLVRYLTHPQVQIDPDVPVPQWGLSAVGRGRTEALADAAWLSRTTQIVASAERKAIETAEILAKPRGLLIEVREAMHENDRSATGFLPPLEFESRAPTASWCAGSRGPASRAKQTSCASPKPCANAQRNAFATSCVQSGKGGHTHEQSNSFHWILCSNVCSRCILCAGGVRSDNCNFERPHARGGARAESQFLAGRSR